MGPELCLLFSEKGKDIESSQKNLCLSIVNIHTVTSFIPLVLLFQKQGSEIVLGCV